MGQKEFAGHIFLHRFPPGCIPGAEVAHRIARYQFRRQYFVLRFSGFLFSGACRRGRHRVGSGLPVPGQRKSGSTLADPRTLYCSRNISGKPAKAPELPAAPSAPLAHRAAVLFATAETYIPAGCS